MQKVDSIFVKRFELLNLRSSVGVQCGAKNIRPLQTGKCWLQLVSVMGVISLPLRVLENLILQDRTAAQREEALPGAAHRHREQPTSNRH